MNRDALNASGQNQDKNLPDPSMGHIAGPRLHWPESTAESAPEPVTLDPIRMITENVIPPSKPKRPNSVFREYVLPLLLLLISVITTTAIGARYTQNFTDGLPTVVSDSDLWPWPWLLQHPARFAMGWPFSLTLLTILLSHEFGHYFACRVHNIRCTLPLVLPAPTLSGTAGAVIQIRGRIPSRRALLDVGIYGPLAGYAASVVAVIFGMLLSHPLPRNPTPPLLEFGQPLTLRVIHASVALFEPASQPFATALRHPILIAGWVGLFITALNLIPGGQLDGGHILYAISPRWHKISTRLLPFVLILCGLVFWIGWILWAIILWIPAMRHPVVPEDEPLGTKRLFLAALALPIFLLTLSCSPFAGTSVLHYIWPNAPF